MPKRMISMTITALRCKLPATLESLAGMDRPLLVTRHGDPLAVVVAPELWRRLKGERELLRRLALGEMESAAGQGHPLDEVLADCDLLLEEN